MTRQRPRSLCAQRSDATTQAPHGAEVCGLTASDQRQCREGDQPARLLAAARRRGLQAGESAKPLELRRHRPRELRNAPQHAWIDRGDPPSLKPLAAISFADLPRQAAELTDMREAERAAAAAKTRKRSMDLARRMSKFESAALVTSAGRRATLIELEDDIQIHTGRE